MNRYSPNFNIIQTVHEVIRAYGNAISTSARAMMMDNFINPTLVRQNSNDSYEIALGFSFEIRITFSPYGEDGNTAICEESALRLYCDVLVTQRHKCFVRAGTDFHALREAEYKCTGSHTSCWFDGWDGPIKSIFDAEVDGLVPSGYSDLVLKSKSPFYIHSNCVIGSNCWNKLCAVKIVRNKDLHDYDIEDVRPCTPHAIKEVKRHMGLSYFGPDVYGKQITYKVEGENK